ncbi:MAG: TetR family transcriptional regulator [Lachnospiraceae bacterium]|nr:TetR family transcriptional regulator [Lachnospiraceae bacterium]
MARAGLDKEIVIRKAAELANEIGFEKITLKLLAENLNVQPPSLYNHIKGIGDLQRELMLFGWRQMEENMIEAAVCVSGYEALEAICHAFYKYAIENPGVFNTMLWYNKFESDETHGATEKIFSVIYKIFIKLNISKENCDHLIRTFRSFLEGFALLVNNKSFGNSILIEESFNISLQVLIAGTKTLEERGDKEDA